MRAFRRGSPFGVRWFKTYSPVSSEDVATRCAASLSSHSPFPLMPTWSQMMVGGDASQRNPRNADCRGGVFATRRFPRPRPAMRIPSSYLRRTNVVPSPYHRRYILGFRLKAKSEHEATHVFGWYGVGTEMVLRISSRHWGLWNCSHWLLPDDSLAVRAACVLPL